MCPVCMTLSTCRPGCPEAAEHLEEEEMAVIAVSLHLRGETLRADAKDLSGANPDFGIVLHLRSGDEDISIFDLSPERMESLADEIRAEAQAIRADRSDRALLAALGVDVDAPIDTEVGAFEVTASLRHPEEPSQPAEHDPDLDYARATIDRLEKLSGSIPHPECAGDPLADVPY